MNLCLATNHHCLIILRESIQWRLKLEKIKLVSLLTIFSIWEYLVAQVCHILGALEIQGQVEMKQNTFPITWNPFPHLSHNPHIFSVFFLAFYQYFPKCVINYRDTHINIKYKQRVCRAHDENRGDTNQLGICGGIKQLKTPSNV